MSNRFKLYSVSMKYIRNLHNVDEHVPSVSPQIGKQTRPFLGVVVLIHGAKYCIPLTSNSGNKTIKFAQMRENITFRKITDEKGNILAGLNLNNMIPIRDEYISEINLRISPQDTKKEIQWKQLCIKELNWCQAHQNEIEHLANELYQQFTSDKPFSKRSICLNFPALEKECNKAKKV